MHQALGDAPCDDRQRQRVQRWRIQPADAQYQNDGGVNHQVFCAIAVRLQEAAVPAVFRHLVAWKPALWQVPVNTQLQR